MITRVLSQKLTEQYELLRGALQRSVSLAERCSDSNASKVLCDRLSQLQSAALFVIVGEVKAGKSSFVNALLGDTICEVDPKPCTLSIQELAYGPERTKINLGANWERLFLPKDVLKEITIVDTPGTNSTIRDHQTITENYIHQCDLVIFVLSATNPHTGTAWDLLSLIHNEWRREVVFILQASDRASQRELDTNIEEVRQNARKQGIQNPLVFKVSAKREMEGASDSGFTEFRQYLRNAVETGEVWKFKVEGAKGTISKIVQSLESRLALDLESIYANKVFFADLKSKIESRRQKAKGMTRLAVDSLCQSYERLANKLEGGLYSRQPQKW